MSKVTNLMSLPPELFRRGCDEFARIAGEDITVSFKFTKFHITCSELAALRLMVAYGCNNTIRMEKSIAGNAYFVEKDTEAFEGTFAPVEIAHS